MRTVSASVLLYVRGEVGDVVFLKLVAVPTTEADRTKSSGVCQREW